MIINHNTLNHGLRHNDYNYNIISVRQLTFKNVYSAAEHNLSLASRLRLNHSLQLRYIEIRGVMRKFLNPPSEPTGGCWGGGGVKRAGSNASAGQQCIGRQRGKREVQQFK